MPDNRKPDDVRLGFICAGVGLMVVAALMFIFIEIGLKEVTGLAFLFIIGLGLTVAGSPDPRKEDDDAGSV